MANLDRRSFIAAVSLMGAAGAANAAPTPAYRVLAEGLQYPEAALELPSGDILLVEIARGTVTRVRKNGKVEVFAELGGGPTGMAIGPDGALYVCNNGGLNFKKIDGRLRFVGSPDPAPPGYIQRVDLRTRAVTTLYSEVDGHPLSLPNDIVFDEFGGFWFTDTGKEYKRTKDHGGLYWAKADGSEIREVVYPLSKPNGIAIGPDRRTLYVTLNERRQAVRFRIIGAGQLEMEGASTKVDYLCSLPRQYMDNLAVQADGALVIASILPGALSTFSPEGELIDQMLLPDVLVTSVSFAGKNLKKALVTLASTGKLIEIDWPSPGMPLLYE